MSFAYHYDYAPQGPTLEAYILDRSRRALICGPLNSGKTNASCWKLFRLICGQEPDANGVRKSRWAAVRNTYPDLLGTTAKDWLELFGGLGRFVKSGYEVPTHTMVFALDDKTVVNAEVVFMALDRPEHVRKLRGTQLTGGWLNETKELPLAIVSMLDGRVGRYPNNVEPTWYGIFGDTNAPDTDHWYYRFAEVDKPAGWAFHKQPGGLVRDGSGGWKINPAAENIQNQRPAGGRHYVELAQGKSDDWIKVNLVNEYGYAMDGKPVYPDYSDSLHCQPFELVRALGVHIGLDFGLTPAALFCQRMPNGQWRVVDELTTERAGVARFAGELKAMIAAKFADVPILSITGDPSGNAGQAGDDEERTVFQLLKANGIEALPASTNEFSIRTEAFSAPMRRLIDGKPGFLIHPQCKVTRKGLAGAYHYRRMQIAGEERYRDMPEKNHPFSDACDAGQYALLGAGEGAAVVANNNSATWAADFRRQMGYEVEEV